MIPLEVAKIKARTYFRTLVRLAGLALILLGAYNLLLSPFYGTVSPGYRQLGFVMLQEGSGYWIGDMVLIGLGAVVAWFG